MAALNIIMNKKLMLPIKAPTAIDGEYLARAARNPARLSKAVWKLRGHGFTEREILQALVNAKTVISPLRFRGGA